MVRKNMHKIISVNGVSITINKKDILNNINLEIYDEGISDHWGSDFANPMVIAFACDLSVDTKEPAKRGNPAVRQTGSQTIPMPIGLPLWHVNKDNSNLLQEIKLVL